MTNPDDPARKQGSVVIDENGDEVPLWCLDDDQIRELMLANVAVDNVPVALLINAARKYAREERQANAAWLVSRFGGRSSST